MGLTASRPAARAVSEEELLQVPEKFRTVKHFQMFLDLKEMGYASERVVFAMEAFDTDFEKVLDLLETFEIIRVAGHSDEKTKEALLLSDMNREKETK